MEIAVIVLAVVVGSLAGMVFYFARRALTADERATMQVCTMGERYERRVERLLDRVHAVYDGTPLDRFKRAVEIPRMVEMDHKEKLASIEAETHQPEAPVLSEVGGGSVLDGM